MVKVNSKSQKGRSMVEMLGVLAIVGTLSVGGISAYGVAMKKHKANELLHQASMLATTISAQAMTNDGKLPQTITSFGNSNYGTFSPSTTDALDGKGFSIEISNMDSAVCTQMEKMAGGMVQGASCSGTTLTLSYYKNLATDPAEGEKSPTGGSGGTADPLCQDVKCETGQQCIGGACAAVTPNTTNGCSNNSDCDDWCKTNGGGEKCYCSINADYLDDDSACYNNFTGQCAVATRRSGVTGGYTVSSGRMTWWSAVNFCKAHNTSLVSLANLGITGGYQDDAYCDRDCTGTVNWADLRNKIGEEYYWVWVTDAVSCDGGCKAGSNNNSCYAFAVNLSSGAVASHGRNVNAYALCE